MIHHFFKSKNNARLPISPGYPDCVNCHRWQAKYGALEMQYRNLQEECTALREERRSLLIAERRESWRANWKF